MSCLSLCRSGTPGTVGHRGAKDTVGPTGTVRVPHHVSSAATIRRRVAAELRARKVKPKVVDDAALVLSELVGNSIRHASPLPSGELEVSWGVDGDVVELRVTDGGGNALPEPRAVEADELSGRGLSIVAKVAAAWGVEYTTLGTTVWAKITGGRRGVGGDRIRMA